MIFFHHLKAVGLPEKSFDILRIDLESFFSVSFGFLEVHQFNETGGEIGQVSDIVRISLNGLFILPNSLTELGLLKKNISLFSVFIGELRVDIGQLQPFLLLSLDIL